MITRAQSSWEIVKAVLRREILVDNLSKLSILYRLLGGPVGNLVTTGIFFTGLFRSGKVTSFGDINDQTFSIYLLVGFLIHIILNGGYYGLSSKIDREHQVRTLGLFFLFPIKPYQLLFFTCIIEMSRTLVMVIATLLLISWIHPLSIAHLLVGIPFLVPVFLLSVFLGILRGSVLVCFRHLTDFMDAAYMFFLLLGSLYIPFSFYPGFLQPLIKANPIFICKESILGFWLGSGAQELWHPMGTYLFFTSVLLLIGYFLVKRWLPLVLENAVTR